MRINRMPKNPIRHGTIKQREKRKKRDGKMKNEKRTKHINQFENNLIEMHYAFIYHSTPHDYRFDHILSYLSLCMCVCVCVCRYILIENVATTPHQTKQIDNTKKTFLKCWQLISNNVIDVCASSCHTR